MICSEGLGYRVTIVLRICGLCLGFGGYGLELALGVFVLG